MQQLAEGGKMIIPVGEHYNQVLYLLGKGGKIRKTATLPRTICSHGAGIITCPTLREREKSLAIFKLSELSIFL